MTCAEVGQRMTVNVSAYSDRAVILRARRGTKRCLVVNFGGVLGKGRTITSAEFRTYDSFIGHMTNGRIDGADAIVDMDLAGLGHIVMRCTATLDNGEAWPVVFEIHVTGAPWFPGEVFPGAGAEQLVAVAV